jgi:hypothetical protein
MRIVLLAAALIAAAPPALAQGDGTPAERNACKADVYRLCSPGLNDLLDHSRIIKCLAANKQKLIPACRAVLLKHHL